MKKRSKIIFALVFLSALGNVAFADPKLNIPSTAKFCMVTVNLGDSKKSAILCEEAPVAKLNGGLEIMGDNLKEMQDKGFQLLNCQASATAIFCFMTRL